MFRSALSMFFSVFLITLGAQPVPDKLNAAWQNFMADGQLQYSTAGICVMDAQTGKILFGRNENIGMAPASTQKVFTSVAAFEALGKDYRYQTDFGYTGNISHKVLNGNLVVKGSGDPTLGSWRYAATKNANQLKQMFNAIKKAGIDTIAGGIIEQDKGFDINPVPPDWMWGDIGNYYGAGHWALNWAENQYDVYLSSGTTGTPTTIKKNDLDAEPIGLFNNEVVSGNANTGDGTIIYAAPFSQIKLMQGEVSSNQGNFGPVSGSSSFADKKAVAAIQNILKENGIASFVNPIAASDKLSYTGKSNVGTEPFNYIGSIQSPSLDSIVYWFLKKSINLYGEGLLRTVGLEKEGFGSTQNGLKWVDSFYTANHIDIRAKHMRDGSGLSPTNRVTPTALVLALQLAKTKSWFNYFYDALPVYNGMKLKSGTIHRTKCYAGYHTSKEGRQYIVSLMVNNYNGETNALVEKIFKVLDILK